MRPRIAEHINRLRQHSEWGSPLRIRKIMYLGGGERRYAAETTSSILNLVKLFIYLGGNIK